MAAAGATGLSPHFSFHSTRARPLVPEPRPSPAKPSLPSNLWRGAKSEPRRAMPGGPWCRCHRRLFGDGGGQHRVSVPRVQALPCAIRNDPGRPCGPGASGKVVVTALYNYAMPLLRYAVGDIAEVGAPCGCGRTLPVLSRILGRARDVVVLPSGARRYAYFGSKAIANFTEIVQFQLAQKSLYDLEVRLVTRGAFGATNEEKLRRLLNETLGEHFSITFDYRDAIPHSASGKYLDFVSELPV